MRSLRFGAAITAATLGATAALAAGAQAGYFNPKGTYDCQVYQAGLGYFTHVDYYRFGANHTYYVALARSGWTLKAPVTKGRYRLSGDRIIPSSGLLKRAGEYMLIESNVIVIRKNNGHITGLSCELVHPKPPTTMTTPPPQTTPAGTPFPLGTYTCYQTGKQTDQISGTTTYTSGSVATVTFNANGTYQKQGNLIPGDWHQTGSAITFTTGVFWETANQDAGAIYPSGTSMPDAQPNVPSSGYTLVIRDTVQGGGDPPSQEFSSNDGPNGTGSQPQSFYYCRQ